MSTLTATSISGPEVLIPTWDDEELENPVELVYQYGIEAKVFISNFRALLGLQSGAAIINPTVQIQAKLSKNKSISYNLHRQPQWVQDHFASLGDGTFPGAKKAVRDYIATALEDQLGIVFNYGDEILAIDLDRTLEDGTIQHYHWPILKHTDKNQPLTLQGIGAWDGVDTKRNSFGEEIQRDIIKGLVTLELDITSQWWKLRNDGIKATTVPAPITFLDLDGNPLALDWQVMFGLETLKGKSAHLVAYCNHHPGVVNVVEGTYTSIDGSTVINLMDGGADNPINIWKAQNTREVWAVIPMCNAEWRSLLYKASEGVAPLDYLQSHTHRGADRGELAQAKVDGFDLVVLETHPDHVIIAERIEVLADWDNMAGVKYNVEVEIATPREASTSSEKTFTAMQHLALQNQEVSESISLWSAEPRQVIGGIIEMMQAQNKPAPGVTQFCLTEVGNVDGIPGLVAFRKMLNFNVGDEANDREVLKKLDKLFPNGILVQTNSTQSGDACFLMLNFRLISRMAGLIGGVAEGFAQELIALLAFAQDSGNAKGWQQTTHGKARLVRAGMDGWLAKMLESKSLLKELLRSYPNLLMNYKVRTVSCFPELNHELGELPKVGIHPDDHGLRVLSKLPNGRVNPSYCYQVPMEFEGQADGYCFPEMMVPDKHDPDTLVRRKVKHKLIWSPWNMAGAVIGIERVPMPMVGAYELVITENAEPGTWLMLGDGRQGIGHSLHVETALAPIEAALYAILRTYLEGGNAVDRLPEVRTLLEQVVALVEAVGADDDSSLTQNLGALLSKELEVEDILSAHTLVKVLSLGAGPLHEGDTDGDGGAAFNLEVHTLGLVPDWYI